MMKPGVLFTETATHLLQLSQELKVLPVVLNTKGEVTFSLEHRGHAQALALAVAEDVAYSHGSGQPFRGDPGTDSATSGQRSERSDE